MRDDSLVKVEEPIREEGQIPGDFVSTVIEDIWWLDRFRGDAADILQTEDETAFDTELKRIAIEPLLNACKLTEVCDPLGIYESGSKKITIDPDKIAKCSDAIRYQGVSFCNEDLRKVVEIHEEAHALHHLAQDRLMNGEIWEDFSNTPSYLKEILAQHFTFSYCKSKPELYRAFLELESRQPVEYRLWRVFQSIPKEVLYWLIRGTLRIDKYLESFGFGVPLGVKFGQKISRKANEGDLTNGNSEPALKDTQEGQGTQTNRQASGRNYWQIAAGDSGREYDVEVFLTFGVMLVGDGASGDYKQYSNPSGKPITDFGGYIPSFADQVKAGDRVVLKKGYGVGTWEVIAVGEVASDYFFEPVFEDVEGWDLRHCRKVCWKQVTPNEVNKPGFTRGTFKRIYNVNAKILADDIWNNGVEFQSVTIPNTKLSKVEDDVLIDNLIGHGLSVSDSEVTTTTIRKLRRLAKWYTSYSKDVSEHEIRTFLVVPLLLALGWPEQKLKIEWVHSGGRIDVAAFKEVYSRVSTPNLLIETKAIGTGLQLALKQLQTYAKNFTPVPEKLVATDGIRYRMLRQNNQVQETYYMNLLTLRDRHPYDDKIKGAVELFLGLLP